MRADHIQSGYSPILGPSAPWALSYLCPCHHVISTLDINKQLTRYMLIRLHQSAATIFRQPTIVLI